MKHVSDERYFTNPHTSESLKYGMEEGPSSPVVTIWRGVTEGGQREGVHHQPVEVVYRRTVTAEQQAELDRLTADVEMAHNGTDSSDWNDTQQRLADFEASLTEVFDVRALRDRAQTDSYSYQLARDLGIDVAK